MTLAGALCARWPLRVSLMTIESLEARRGAEGATILAAIARLGSGREFSMADAALQRLREGGLESELPEALGERSLEEALLYAPGEADLYLFRLGRPGDRCVQIGYLVIERSQGGGVLVDGTLSEPLEQDDADPLLHRLGREVGIAELRGRPISAEQLVQAIRDACDRARKLEMAVEPELWFALSVLGRALGIEADALSLPLARDGSPLQVDPEDEGLFAEVSGSLLDDFEDWVEEEEKDEGPLRRNGGYVASSMLHWKWGYADGDLGHWSLEEVEEFLLDYAPRKLDTDEEVIADGPDCVAGLLSFLDQAGVLAGTRCPRSSPAARSCGRGSQKRRRIPLTGVSPSRWSRRCSRRESTPPTAAASRPGSTTSTHGPGRSATRRSARPSRIWAARSGGFPPPTTRRRRSAGRS